MDEETTQERLIREFFNEQIFGDPHHFAARQEILDLRAKLEKYEPQKHGKAEKGRGIFPDA